MSKLLYYQNGKWHDVLPVISTGIEGVLAVENNKLCTKTASIKGINWSMAEAAVALEKPYLKEYGYKCAVEDGTADVYEWLYRCAKEGFSVPYRTIIVDGKEYKFITKLDKYSSPEWYSTASKTSTKNNPYSMQEINGINKDDIAFMCMPFVQFGGMTNEEITYAYVRMRLDNPSLCLPPNVFITRNDAGLATYLYIEYHTENVINEINYLIDRTTKAIDEKVNEYAYDIVNGVRVLNKKKAAKVIHDYLVIIANPSVSVPNPYKPTGVYTPTQYVPIMYGVINTDKNYRALCDGYTQAFNYFLRLYGINCISMTSDVTIKETGKADKSAGGHIFNVVNFSAPYGEYPTDPAEWTVIDIYWDEPLHELSLGFTYPGGDVFWKYFCRPDTVFLEEGSKYYVRKIESSRSYGRYPFDLIENGSRTYRQPALVYKDAEAPAEEHYKW